MNVESIKKNWKELAAAAALAVAYVFAKDPRFVRLMADLFLGVTIVLIAIVFFFKKAS